MPARTVTINAYPPGQEGQWYSWNYTDGDQMVHFEYYGDIKRLIILSCGAGDPKYYDGPPIPSWGSPGCFGAQAIGTGHGTLNASWRE